VGDLDGAESGIMAAVGSKRTETQVEGQKHELITYFIIGLGLIEEAIEIDKIIAIGPPEKPAMFKVSLFTRWCFNRGCEHSSNRVYLMVSCAINVVAFWYSYVVSFLCSYAS
jgi:hypothetical protein